MNSPMNCKSWSPFVVGGAIGILSWFSFASVNKPLGITSPFEQTAAWIANISLGDSDLIAQYSAAKSSEVKKLAISWEWMLVVGVFIGAFLSSKMSGDRQSTVLPELWKQHFGKSVLKRLCAAFLGGGLMMFGARIAQGCTSGHGISGTLQLAISSWSFVGVMFAVATAFSFLLYGRKTRHV